MNIVYACDDGYAMLVGVSVQSLFEANKDADIINVFVLSSGVSADNKKNLEAVAEKYGRSLSFVEVNDDVLNAKALNIDVQRWSIAAFARLFTPQLLPDLTKILYLDCDTLVLGALKDLWNTDFGDFTCAAVAEPFGTLHKANVGMTADDVYYNSGVMLIDLNKWRQIDAKKEFIASIQRHSGCVPYVDQGVLNEVFRKQIIQLPAKYNVYTEYYDFSYEEVNKYRDDKNVYSEAEIESAKNAPVVVHFVSSFLTPRPWVENSTHPYAKQWDKILSTTPWCNVAKRPDNPGKSKLMLRYVFTHTPRKFGVLCAKLLNSYVRPILDRKNLTKKMKKA